MSRRGMRRRLDRLVQCATHTAFAGNVTRLRRVMGVLRRACPGDPDWSEWPITMLVIVELTGTPNFSPEIHELVLWEALVLAQRSERTEYRARLLNRYVDLVLGPRHRWAEARHACEVALALTRCTGRWERTLQRLADIAAGEQGGRWRFRYGPLSPTMVRSDERLAVSGKTSRRESVRVETSAATPCLLASTWAAVPPWEDATARGETITAFRCLCGGPAVATGIRSGVVELSHAGVTVERGSQDGGLAGLS